MSKTSIMRIGLIVGSVIVILGVSLLTWVLVTEEEQNVIDVKLSGGESQTVTFESLTLVPGEACEYVVDFEKSGMDTYDLRMDFIEKQKGKTLKNFARVKILAGEELICDKLLAEAFEDESLVVPVVFSEKKNTELRIVYYMPIEVGNEAKNAEAEFELLFTASNE